MKRIIFPELDTVPDKRDCVDVYFYRDGYWTTFLDRLLQTEYGEKRVIVGIEEKEGRAIPIGPNGRDFGAFGWTNLGIRVLRAHNVTAEVLQLARRAVKFGELAQALYKAGRIWFEKDPNCEDEIQAIYGRENNLEIILDDFYCVNR